MANLTLGNSLSAGDGTVRSEFDRHNCLTSGHRACQGCAEALAASCALGAAHKATNGNIVVVNATGCLEVFSCVYPDNNWDVPWLHSLFGNAPAVATGVAAALRTLGKTDTRVIAQGGDGSTADIGMGTLSGMFERNDDILYICYDNQAYMNTGVQRSGATPAFARTATTMPNGTYMGSEFATGKNVPEIAVAHKIPYTATASVANIRDLEEKIARAVRIKGAKYIHIHVPCPLGWGFHPSETIKVARLAVECGLFPLYEAEYGTIAGAVPIDDPKPVEEYLRVQRRFAHLFGKNSSREMIDALQRIATENIDKYRLSGGVSNG